MKKTARVTGCGIAFGAALAWAGGAAAENVQYEGTAQAVDGGAFLYKESHFVEREDDGPGTRLVLYRCADGRPFAVKRVTYVAGSLTPDFELEDARLAYREGVRTTPRGREVFVHESKKKGEKTAKLPKGKGLVADAAFDDFVRRYWDTLQSGKTIELDFLVPSDLEAMGFKVKKASDASVFGQPGSLVRLQFDAWFGGMLPSLDVTYSNDRRELLRFEGLSNLRDLDGDNYTARIDFDPKSRQPLDPVARDAAAKEPLVKSCK